MGQCFAVVPLARPENAIMSPARPGPANEVSAFVDSIRAFPAFNLSPASVRGRTAKKAGKAKALPAPKTSDAPYRCHSWIWLDRASTARVALVRPKKRLVSVRTRHGEKRSV